MQVQVDIGYDQLVNMVKQLPKNQWTKLKSDIEAQDAEVDSKSDMLAFLLNGPTFSKKQITEIEKARKEINQWRTK